MATVKDFDSLTIRDAFMFGKVMEDATLCSKFLSTLLQYDVGEMTLITREKEFLITIDGKPIRFDLYSEDARQKIYDSEMQNLPPHRSVDSLMLPLRTRFYQSAIDYDTIDKGSDYAELKECRILFVCTFDPFGKGRYIYSFKRTCIEDPSVNLNDLSEIIFFNATSTDESIPNSIRELFDYIEEGKIGGPFSREIDNSVKRVKTNSIFRSEYMKLRTMMTEERRWGYEDGRADGRADEQANTLREKERADAEKNRADAAENRADAAEAEVARLRALLDKQQN